jgi:hypothetical protein
MLGKARELKVSDQWIYSGVIYTVERDGETNVLYFKHPSERAGRDDHIAIEHIDHGDLIYKEQ